MLLFITLLYLRMIKHL